MRKRILIIILSVLSFSNVHAMYGKLVLRNGHSVSGDIRKLDDGGYWVTNKSGSIKFEKSEIKSVKILSKKDG